MYKRPRKKGTNEPKDGTVLKKQSSTDPLALSVYLVSYKVVQIQHRADKNKNIFKNQFLKLYDNIGPDSVA